MKHRQVLPGSEGDFPAGAQSVAAVRKDEEITISLYLRSNDMPAGGESCPLERAELAARRTSKLRPALEAIREYAQGAGLKVASEDPARLLMRLVGTAADVERAFGVELLDCDVGGKPCRIYRGSIHLPSRLIPLVTAVLGLDDRPAAQVR